VGHRKNVLWWRVTWPTQYATEPPLSDRLCLFFFKSSLSISLIILRFVREDFKIHLLSALDAFTVLLFPLIIFMSLSKVSSQQISFIQRSKYTIPNNSYIIGCNIIIQVIDPTAA